MRILRTIVGPPAHRAVITAAHVLWNGTVGPRPIRHDRLGPPMSLHRFLQEFEGCIAIARPSDVALQYLALVINIPPKIVHLTVDLHVRPVKMPSSLGKGPHSVDPPATDPGGKHRA